jgi:hypothetical protein
MGRRSRAVSSVLLLGFVGVNVFAWACLLGMPVSAYAGAHCDRGAATTETGVGIHGIHDCCVTGIAETGLLCSATFGASPPVVGVVPDASFGPVPAPAISSYSQRPIPPAASPPVFVLVSSLLI